MLGLPRRRLPVLSVERGTHQAYEQVQIVLDIVRQVLRTRTDWVPQGQVLLEEILAKVEKVPNSLKP